LTGRVFVIRGMTEGSTRRAILEELYLLIVETDRKLGFSSGRRGRVNRRTMAGLVVGGV